jgi:hypothetical protein
MAYVAADLEHLMASAKSSKKGYVGINSECVSLVRAFTNAPPVGLWHQGAKVHGDHALTRGTVIATFVDGHYDGHAAIYLGDGVDGIRVFDQWNGQVPHERTIYATGHHGFVNTADNYYVVE